MFFKYVVHWRQQASLTRYTLCMPSINLTRSFSFETNRYAAPPSHNSICAQSNFCNPSRTCCTIRGEQSAHTSQFPPPCGSGSSACTQCFLWYRRHAAMPEAEADADARKEECDQTQQKDDDTGYSCKCTYAPVYPGPSLPDNINLPSRSCS